MDKKANHIRQSVENRGIKMLLHFTQLRNLQSIVEHGFLSRSMCEALNITPYVSRAVRLDSNYDAISVSVSAFDHNLFGGKRWKTTGIHWIVLALDVSILWKHPCLFHARTAASREAQRRSGRRDHGWAFDEMFEESSYSKVGVGIGQRWREETEIPDCLTTFPDAEVQVLAPFSSELITGAWVDHDEHVPLVRELLDRLPGEPRFIDVGKFAPRFSNGYVSWG
jgi:hypothetical protein